MSEFSFMEGGHDAGGEHGISHGQEGSHGGASTTPAWNSSFKGVKFSDMVQGINITPNFMLAMLFLGFTSWLFVVYWIRHNEPLANQVLGTPTAGAPTSHADRRIVAGAKFALPIRSNSAEFYTPDKKLRGEQKGSSALPTIGDPSHFTEQSKEAFQSFDSSPAMAGGSAAYGLPGNNHSKLIKEGREHIVVHHPEPLMAQPATQYGMPAQHNQNAAMPLGGQINQPYAQFGQPAQFVPGQQQPQFLPGQQPQAQNGCFRMHVGSAEGTKLRTVVSR